MQNKLEILIPDTTFHVYNRANGNEKIFLSDDNYKFFSEKYKKYISNIADTFCYCLMPNHFHFLLRIKSEKEIAKFCQRFATLTELQQGNYLSKQFSHMLNGYAQAINKQENRKGSLFIRPFKRKKITDEKYILKLVHYIHFNPVEAGLAEKPEEWKYSSYKTLSGLPTPDRVNFNLKKEEVTEWFGDLENFIYCHKYPPKETGIEDF